VLFMSLLNMRSRRSQPKSSPLRHVYTISYGYSIGLCTQDTHTYPYGMRFYAYSILFECWQLQIQIHLQPKLQIEILTYTHVCVCVCVCSDRDRYKYRYIRWSIRICWMLRLPSTSIFRPTPLPPHFPHFHSHFHCHSSFSWLRFLFTWRIFLLFLSHFPFPSFLFVSFRFFFRIFFISFFFFATCAPPRFIVGILLDTYRYIDGQRTYISMLVYIFPRLCAQIEGIYRIFCSFAMAACHFDLVFHIFFIVSQS